MNGVFKTVTFIVLVFAAAVFAEDYDVGDDAEWARPSDVEFYPTWATGKTFRVGDELEFEFAAGRHDVAVVTQDAYETCDKEKPISHFTTPPVKIRLNTTGPHYFICTVAEHCRFGQKLAINVVGAGGVGGGATKPGSPPGGSAGGLPPTSPGGVDGLPPTSPEAGITPPVSGGTPGAGTTTPTTGETGSTETGSTETTTTIPSGGNVATSLGGATFWVAFVSTIVALF